MFVITAIVGNSFRNDRSLSSASATINSPRPSRALLPNALSRPPITAVGSSPARSSTSAIIDVVVVLPCAPATAMLNRSRISSASISARGITGICRRAASPTSGFVGRTADDTTTTSASPTLRRVVSLRDADAERLEPVGHRGRLLVRSADRVPEIGEQLGDAAHADAADADEMNPPRCSVRPSTCADVADRAPCARSTITFAASGLRERSRRARHPRPRRSRRRRSAQNPLRQRRPGRVALQQHLGGARPPPALRRSSAGGRRSPSAAESESPAVPPPPPPRASSRPRGRRSGPPAPSAVPCRRRTARLGLNPRRPVAGSDHFHISFSRLVRETKMRTARPPAPALPPPWPR